jgi:hypothetical protein
MFFLYIFKVFGIISPTPRCAATVASSSVSTSAEGPGGSGSVPADLVPGKKRAGRPKKAQATVVVTTPPPQADTSRIAAKGGEDMAPLCMLPGLPHQDLRKAYLESMPSKTSLDTLRLADGMRLFRPSPSTITSLVEKVSFLCCGVKRTPLAYRKTGNYIRPVC